MVVAGVGVADSTVLIVLIALCLVLWILLQVRAPLGNVPVVGGTGVNLLDGLRGNVQKLALAMEGWLSGLQAATASGWDWLIHQTVDAGMAALSRALTDQATTLKAFLTVTLPKLQQDLTALTQLVNGQLMARLLAVESAVASDELYARTVLAAGLATATADIAVLSSDVARLRVDVDAAAQQLVQDAATLALLVQALPALRALLAAEAAQLGGLVALPAELDQLQGRVQGISEQLAKLLSLLGLASLSAVAIAELVRIAKDPCSICPGLDLSGVEGRLESLEAFGQV